MLRDLHDDLDGAVAEAYGWSPDVSTEDVLFRLVELNAARAAEERSGLVRWLRPEFQNVAATQAGFDVEGEEEEAQPAPSVRTPWPSSLPERVSVVRNFLRQTPAPVPPETVARNFVRARSPEVSAILENTGRAWSRDKERYGVLDLKPRVKESYFLYQIMSR